VSKESQIPGEDPRSPEADSKTQEAGSKTQEADWKNREVGPERRGALQLIARVLAGTSAVLSAEKASALGGLRQRSWWWTPWK